jgi:glycogen debranching enzyme
MKSYEAIAGLSQAVLQTNQVNGYVVPHLERFNSRFLWDGALTARAISLYDPYQAAEQIEFILDGQHPNGMIPNESSKIPYLSITEKPTYDYTLENGVSTSGITQPPTIVHSALEVSKTLGYSQRQIFLEKNFGRLKNYLRWFKQERCPDGDGLAVSIHMFETGRDNSPEGMQVHQEYYYSKDRSLGKKTFHAIGKGLISIYRKNYGDLRSIDVSERTSNAAALINGLQYRKIRRHAYNLDKIKNNSDIPLLKDVGFNALLIEANESLKEMATMIDNPDQIIEPDLLAWMDQLRAGFEDKLWHTNPTSHLHSGYYSLDARTQQPIKIQTVSGIIPLIATENHQRAAVLLKQVSDKFWANYPLSSVAVDSQHLEPSGKGYWRGAAWPMIADIIERGLTKHSALDQADQLREEYIRRPAEPYKSEQHNIFTGEPLGVRNFSPTAAVDLVFAKKQSINKL